MSTNLSNTLSTTLRKRLLLAALCPLLATVPAVAQDTMAGMDMSPATSASSAPATAAKVKQATKPKPVTSKPAPSKPTKKSSPADAMAGMNMSGSDMQGMDMSGKAGSGKAGDTQPASAPMGEAMPDMPMPSTDPSADPAPSGMQESSMSGMDHSGMDHSGTNQSDGKQPGTQHAMPAPPPATTGAVQRLQIGEQIGVRPVVRGLGLKPMKGGAMQGMPPMQGGKAPADARSPDYSEGVGYGSANHSDMAMDDNASHTMLLIDQLEATHGRDANGSALNAQAWYGNDDNKLWLKASGNASGGRLQDLRTEALWDHTVATYWDTQLGVRHDFGVGPGRNWAAFGVQGLAPYWFDIQATAYVGPSGRTAARFELEYELLLTQRLIFQPDFEVNLYGRDDRLRGIGSGLSDANLGLRLRYEFSRQFAPYIGVDLTRKFGRTADLARAAGQPAFDPQIVAGVRFWF